MARKPAKKAAQAVKRKTAGTKMAAKKGKRSAKKSPKSPIFGQDVG